MRKIPTSELPSTPSPENGYNRQWLKCKKCKRLQYYDYIPYSSSSPILTSACGHNFRHDLERVEIK